jgi:hypothetical protein
MSAPCPRPECGGEVHTDGWGNPIRCPRAMNVACAVLHTDAEGNVIPCPGYPHTPERASKSPELYAPNRVICPLVQRTPHDAHEYEGLRCPGWMPDDGTRPEQPPELSELDQLRADNESLRYQIQRAREALATDEPVDERLRQAEIRAAVAEHEAEACRNQVQALVRELLRAREVPDEDLPQKVRVIILNEEAP